MKVNLEPQVQTSVGDGKGGDETLNVEMAAGECSKELSKFATQRNQPIARGEQGILEDVRVRICILLDLNFRNANCIAVYHALYHGLP